MDDGCVEQKAVEAADSGAVAEEEILQTAVGPISEEEEQSSPPALASPSLKADFDGNGCVGFEDFFLLADAYGKREDKFDLNKNNVVDYPDFQIFERELGKGSC